MFSSFLNPLSDNDKPSQSSKKAKRRRQGRVARIEELESREMLSVTAGDFDTIKSDYEDLELGNIADYNIIEIASADLSAVKLQEEIEAAASTAIKDLIVIRTSGTENTITLDGELSINVNAAAQGSVTIVSLGESPLTINAEGQSRIFDVANGTELAVAGLTLTNGFANPNTGGGAVFNSGHMLITECTITGNTAGADSFGGGGIYNYGTLKVSQSVVSNNTSFSTAGGGGGIANLGGTEMMVADTLVFGNTAVLGGGLYNATGTFIITNSGISDNSATSGGGFYNDEGTYDVTNSSFTGNTATTSGGGIYHVGGTSKIENGAFSGNTAASGGGIYHAGGTSNVGNSVFSGNTAINGGGIYNAGGSFFVLSSTVAGNSSTASDTTAFGGGIYNTAAGTISIINGLIAGNRADGYGAGLYNLGTLALTNSTIAGNFSVTGGRGIYTSGAGSSLTIHNSIVARNINSNVATSDIMTISGAAVTGSNNLISNGTEQTGLVNGIDGNQVGTSAAILNPQFTRLMNFTTWSDQLWRTWDFHLLVAPTASPAIDAGDNTFAVDGEGNPIEWDIEGMARYVNETVDLGACEYSDAAVSPPTAPTQFRSVLQTQDTIVLSWHSASPVASTYYEIRQRAAGETWSEWTIYSGTSATITELTDSTSYEFQIRAANSSGGYSTTTVSASASTLGLLVVPTEVTATVKNSTAITVAWKAVADAAGYTIQYATNSGFTAGVGMLLVLSDVTTADLTELTPGTPYYVRVMATGSGTFSNSEYSTSVSATPKLQPLTAPTGLSAEVKSGTELSIAWETVTNAAGYTIQYATNAAFTENVKTQAVDDPAATSFDLTELVTGTTYYVRVMAIGAGDFSDSPYSSPSVTATPIVMLDAPVLTEAAQVNSTTVKVTWEAAANASGYAIQYVVGENFDAEGAAILSVEEIPSTSLTFDVIGLLPETLYSFRVIAVGADSYGNSVPSNEISQTTLAAPLAPEGLTSVEGDKTAVSLSLKWTAPVNPATEVQGYEIQYRESGVSTWTLWGSPIAAAELTATITGLNAEREYEFQVRAVYVSDASGWSESVTATTDLAPLPAPANFKSTAKGKDSVSLAWDTVVPSDEAVIVTGYEVRYRTGSGEWTIHAGITETETAVDISGLLAGTEYTFEVRVIAGEQMSAWSTPSIAAATDPLTPPITPTGLTTTEKTDSSVSLKWNSVSNAVSYEIQYRPAGTTVWTNMPATETTATISDLEAGTVYEFQVLAVNEDGKSNWSTLISTPTVLSIPEGLTDANKTTETITMSWEASAQAERYVLQYRKTGDVEWTLIEVTGTSEIVTYLADNTAYEFQVKAVNAVSESAWSETITVTTIRVLVPPAVPVNLVSSGNTTDSITLTWNTVSNVTGYEIQYRRAGDILWRTVEVTETTRTFSDLAPGEAYEFQVRAVNEDGPSDWSAVAASRTLLPIPADLICIEEGTTTNSVTLEWGQAEGATGYEIRYKIAEATAYTMWSGNRVIERSAVVGGLTDNTAYEFQVRAVNAASESEWSTIAYATTMRIIPAPAAPEEITATAGQNSILLEWVPVEDAVRYEVQYRKAGDTEWTLILTEEPSVTIAELEAGTSYEYQILAANDTGKSDWTGITTITTNLPAPQELRSTSISLNSITMEWNTVTNATNYEIQYRWAGSEEWIPISSVAATSAAVDGLNNGTEYEFRIRSINAVSTSDWSDTVYVSTRRVLVPPATPENLHQTESTRNSIRMEWNGVQNASGYTVRYREAGTEEWISAYVTETSANMDNLISGKEYDWQVRATSSDGDSAWSWTVTATTVPEEPSAPTNFRSTAQTRHSVTLSWNPQDVMQTYRLEYKLSNASDAEWMVWTPAPITTATSMTVNGLNAWAQYDFRLTASNVSGSQFSMTTVSTTTIPAFFPVKPKVKVNTKAATLDSVTVAITPPNKQETLASNDKYVITCITEVGSGKDKKIVETKLTEGENLNFIRTGNTVTGFKISGLTAATTYKIAVTAENADGEAFDANGRDTTINVRAKTVKYNAVKSVKTVKDATTFSSVTLTWKVSSGGDQERYSFIVLDSRNNELLPETLEKITVGAVTETQPDKNGNVLKTVTLSGLSESTRYSVWITAFVGQNAESPVQKSTVAKAKISTATYKKVSSVKTSLDTDGNIALRWNLPTGIQADSPDYQRYEVFWLVGKGKTARYVPVPIGKVNLVYGNKGTGSTTISMDAVKSLEGIGLKARNMFVMRAAATVNGIEFRSLDASFSIASAILKQNTVVVPPVEVPPTEEIVPTE